MAGLGIDLGSPLTPSRGGQQDHSIRAMNLLTSLNQFNIDRNTMHPSPYSSSSSSAASASTSDLGRTVEGSPDRQFARQRTVSVPDNRNRRLSMAVRALQDGNEYDSASDDISEDSTSPRTDVSASTAHTSGHEDVHSHKDRPRHMIRSQSSYSALSEASLAPSRSSGSTTLGRSNASTRYNGRNNGFRAKRLASAPNIHKVGMDGLDDQAIRRSPVYRAPVLQAKRKQSIPDGFGGLIETEDVDSADVGDTTIVPLEPEAASEESIPASSSMSAQRLSMNRAPDTQQYQDIEHYIFPPRPEGMPRSISQPAHLHQGAPHHHMTASKSFAAMQYRVGSFYGPDGRENARLEDEEDFAYRAEDEGSCVGGSEVSAGSSSASRSSAPRSMFMSSPRAESSGHRQQASGSDVSGYSAGGMSSASSGSHVPGTVVTYRSERGWRGLSGAERGEAFISINPSDKTFVQGPMIRPRTSKGADNASILLSEAATSVPNYEMPVRRRQASAPYPLTSGPLDRNGTLISATAHPARRSKDLSRLLGNSNGKLSGSQASQKAMRELQSISEAQMPAPALEQSKPGKGRVDVDLVLESDLVVEGGLLNGRLEIRVRNQGVREERLMLTQPKVRVVGFEELLNEDMRHIFYHHSTMIDGVSAVRGGPSQGYVLHGSPNLSPEMDNRQPLACFASPPDAEGYCLAKEGSHAVPFSIDVPVGKGARGSFRGKNAAVRYIVIGSVKLKSANGKNRSIAHFYRHVDLFPYLNPAVVLSSSPKPLIARVSKNLFLGGTGKVHLFVTLHRHSWVAGQRLFVNLRIDNGTSKRIKNLSFALMRDVTVFKPRNEVAHTNVDEVAHPEAYTAVTTRKKVAEDSLELGQKGSKGHVTARGWWTGVEPGEGVDISHNMIIPHDALSLPRGRHLEVSYQLKVSAGSSLSSDISVELPVRIFNFVSLDPPPLKTAISTRPLSTVAIADEAPAIERIRTADALRNAMPPPALPRPDSGRGSAMGQYGMPPPRAHQPQYGPGASLNPQDQARRMQHQKSLDFINHAIRSATARRGGSDAGMSTQPQGLGIGVDERRPQQAEMGRSSEAPHPSCQPYIHKPASDAQYTRADDFDEDEDFGVGQQTLVLNDESVADIDYVIGSARLDGGESSPAFDQRMAFDDDSSRPLYDPYERDLQDDYGFPARPLPQSGSASHLHRATSMNDDDGATPLAQSPPKFAAGAQKYSDFPGAYTSSPVEEYEPSSYSGYESASSSGHTTGTTDSSVKKLVRTGSDFDNELGRSSTIIRGPSSVARPISPSKHTPSPTKSAMKGRGIQRMDSGDSAKESSPMRGQARQGVPPMLRARVENNQLARPVSHVPLPHVQAMAQQARHHYSHKQAYKSGESDSEMSSGGYDTSPATSAGVTTPTELTHVDAHSTVRGNAKHGDMMIPLEDQMQGLGIAMGLPTATVSATDLSSLSALPQKEADARMTISRSTSTHTICGATVVVPSVRDKIAQLESRKRALRDFTALQQLQSPGSGTSTPTAEKQQQVLQIRGAAGQTPSSLIRNNSTQSDAASSLLSPSNSLNFRPQNSQPAGSVSSFKAPIFR